MTFKKSKVSTVVHAAIYARKSNQENNKTDDDKSCQRQIDRAKEYALKKGWHVSEATIFVDEGISGADFTKREGLKRLRGSIDDFDVIIVSELSRFGRSGDRTQFEILYFIDRGKEIYCYLNDERVMAETEEDRFMLRVKTYTAAVEREKCAMRVYDTLSRKFQMGHAVGGRCYGYASAPIMAINKYDEEFRAYSDPQIKEEEATVVRAIFRAYLDGFGFHAIAKMMNCDSHYSKEIETYLGDNIPKKPVRAGMWQQSLIRQMLLNTRYRGDLTYGALKNVYIDGEKKQKARDEFLTLHREDLRIVDDETWNRVQSRLAERKEDYLAAVENNPSRALIHVSKEQQSNYLLSRMCECGHCNQPYVITGGNTGSGENRRPLRRYGCKGYHKGGDQCCTNNMYVHSEKLDAAILDAVMEQVLSDQAIEYVLGKAHAMLKEYQIPAPEMDESLYAELIACEKEISRLMKAIQFGVGSADLAEDDDYLKPLVTNLASASNKKRLISAKISQLKQHRNVTAIDDQQVTEILREKMNHFTDLMMSDVHKARVALQKLLKSRIRLSPTNRDGKRGLSFQGETVVGGLFSDPKEDELENYTRVNLPS